MIINVCGFGWSGSGAVLDLLREYENVSFPTNADWEFNFLWAPDGLYDLEQKLTRKHCRIFDSDLAIRRFLSISKEYGYKNGIFKYDKVFKRSFYKLCEDYINDLVQFKLHALTFSHSLHPTNKDKIINFYNWILKCLFFKIGFKHNGRNLYDKFCIHNYKEMIVSYNPDNFLEITQNFVDSLLSLVRKEKDSILVLNQSVPPDVPYLFDHFFKEAHKTVLVRRDPRDTYIIIKELKGISKPVPTNLDDFITFYKKTIEDTRIPDTENILSIQFEDLVYNYEDTVLKIEKFVGLSTHKELYKYFKPKQSINNTQLVKLYPKYEDDIKIIEQELSGSLFPFKKYDFVRTNNGIF